MTVVYCVLLESKYVNLSRMVNVFNRGPIESVKGHIQVLGSLSKIEAEYPKLCRRQISTSKGASGMVINRTLSEPEAMTDNIS